QLDHVSVDHGEIPQRDLAQAHLAHGHEHDHRNGEPDDECLTAIEHRQRHPVLQARVFPVLQVAVIALRFELLVDEILHRFVVEQAVYRTRVRAVVHCVRLAHETGATFGDLDRKHCVDQHRHQHRQRITEVEVEQQYDCHHHNFQHRGYDIE